MCNKNQFETELNQDDLNNNESVDKFNRNEEDTIVNKDDSSTDQSPSKSSSKSPSKQSSKLLLNLKNFYENKINCFETEIRWSHVLFMLTVHLISLHALYLLLCLKVKVQTILFAIFLHYLCNIGLTAGVHRLWSHKAYKAKLPLRIFLMLCQTMTFQKSIITWSRDHRIHHKFSETTKDPHDIRRGIFFAHIGWILIRKRPEVFEAGAKISIDDLYEDSVVKFQARIYFPLMLLLCFAIPTAIPVYYWSESYLNAFAICVCLRHAIVLNISFLINSYAHKIGHRKYDLTLKSTDNYGISVLSAGEGTHNFHHSFPFDYSTSELKYAFNFTTSFIDLMAWLGQAYDLRKTTAEVILARRKRTGDLSLFNDDTNQKED